MKPHQRPCGGNAILVGCMPRSGSSLLRVMLDSHPDLVADAESMVTPDGTWNPDTRVLHERWLKIGNGKRFVAKEPRFITLECMKSLRAMFGDDLYLINIVRNPWDTLISYAKTKTAFNFRPFAEGFMRAHIELAKRKWPTKYYVIRYEDIIADPERSMRELCEFLDLEFHQDMLQHHTKKHIWSPPPKVIPEAAKAAFKTGEHHSAAMAKKPIFASSVNQFNEFCEKTGWKPTAEQVGVCCRMAALLGYVSAQG